MYKTKQGMSAIITTLIIIVLALVAIGVVWYIIQNLLGTTEDEVTQGTEDLFDDCVMDMGGTVTTENGTCTGGEIRMVGGEYCCIV